MDAEGSRFLNAACSRGRKWAMEFASLADAWRACGNADFMLWALGRLGKGADYDDSYKTPAQLREKFGNPFPHDAYCFFCNDGPLTAHEQSDSEIVGSKPRCRAHLSEVGLAA